MCATPKASTTISGNSTFSAATAKPCTTRNASSTPGRPTKSSSSDASRHEREVREQRRLLGDAVGERADRELADDSHGDGAAEAARRRRVRESAVREERDQVVDHAEVVEVEDEERRGEDPEGSRAQGGREVEARRFVHRRGRIQLVARPALLGGPLVRPRLAHHEQREGQDQRERPRLRAA